MREIFVESEHPEFRCPPGFLAGGGEVSVGEPLVGGRSRAKPLYMHRLLAPEMLTQEALFVYRNWTGRRCYPDPEEPRSPLWWVVDGEPERFLVIDGERRKARLEQIPGNRPGEAAPAALEADEPAEAGPGAEARARDSAWLPERVSVTVPVTVPEAAPPARTTDTHRSTSGERRPVDPFKRSLEAVLSELTAPIVPDPQRQSQVAVRVVAASGGEGEAGPVSLPSRPELVSSDFLASADFSRPALAPIQELGPRIHARLPNRAFAVLAGVLALVISLAVWLFR